MRKFPKITSQVENLLKSRPDTRNSDVDLTLWVWYTFYQDKLIWDEVGNQWTVSLSNVRDLPSEDRISRARRKFQEPNAKYPNGQYPPTDPEVMAARRRREEDIRTTINTRDWGNVL